MNDVERYLFDLNGFLMVPDLLSHADVDELNRLLDGYELWQQRGQEERFREVWQYGDNYTIVGPAHTWDAPFRRAIGHPRLLGYLTELLGTSVRYDHGHVILMQQGAGRLGLHGGGTPWNPSMYYHWHDDRMHNGMIVVSLALCDMSADEGGFVCVPGSHKANLPCPPEFLTFDETAPTLYRANVRAGSAVLFTEALTHGTYPWSGAHERRSLLMKYTPGHLAYQDNYPLAGDAADATDWTPVGLFGPPYAVHDGEERRPNTIRPEQGSAARA